MSESERPPGHGWLPPTESRDAPAGPPAHPPSPGTYPTAPPPTQAAPPPTYAQGQPHAAPHAVPREPGNGEATAALVLGIIAIVLVVPLGIFAITLPLALICAVIAIVLGRSGRRKVDRGQTSQKRGQAQAGFIMGVVGTVLAVLAILGFVLLGTLSEDFQRDFQRGFESQQEQFQ